MFVEGRKERSLWRIFHVRRVRRRRARRVSWKHSASELAGIEEGSRGMLAAAARGRATRSTKRD